MTDTPEKYTRSALIAELAWHHVTQLTPEELLNKYVNSYARSYAEELAMQDMAVPYADAPDSVLIEDAAALLGQDVILVETPNGKD